MEYEMSKKTERTWKELYDLSTPKEREEIFLLMMAYIDKQTYVKKRKETADDPFPFIGKTWREFSWLQRKRLTAHAMFMNVKQKIQDSLPKHLTLFSNLVLLTVGAFEYIRFEYLRPKKFQHAEPTELKSKKTNSPAGRKSESQRGSGKR
jgi:hypothetical protein